MKYAHKKEESRWYQYGPEKEFLTKQEAIRELERYKTKVLTRFCLDGLYQLYEKDYIEEKKGAIRIIFKYKYVESIL